MKAPYSSGNGYNGIVGAGAIAGHVDGILCEVWGKAAYAGGEDCKAPYWAELVHGRGLRGSEKKIGQVVFGNYNKINDDAVFQIGNGVLDTVRSNAFEVISTRDNNGTNHVSLKVGETVVTENQLKALLALLG